MGRTACTEPQCLYKGKLFLKKIFFSEKIFENVQVFIKIVAEDFVLPGY